MTRETKIGLLVGLAFIIVIGILLSDHLTSSNEPPLATLTQTGNTVRQTISTPGGTQPPITSISAPQQVQPQQPVPTPRELTTPTPATDVVRIGPAPQSQQSQPIQQQQTMQQPPTPIQSQPQQVAGNDTPSNSDLARIAQQHGESLVNVGQQQTSQSQIAGAKDYVAEPGDSVSKMAAKFLGGNTKTNRDAIVRANPSLQQDANKVIVGRTYKIPSAGGTILTESITKAPAAQAPASTPTVASSTEYWYTIQEGDTLTSIARDQLGQDPSVIPSILELNRDVLKDGNKIFVNMKIKLPSKPIAQATN